MREFTSPEVSKRLADAGFQNEKNRQYDGPFYCYRADTLLMWLLSLDAKEVAAKMGLRTLAENGMYGAVRIQKLDNGEYVVQLYRPMEAGAEDVVLADALGLLVWRVMKEMEVKP
jgi:hypothetical protein